MVNISKYIKALLHPAGGHQGSHKAHQAGNQKIDSIYQCQVFNQVANTWLHDKVPG